MAAFECDKNDISPHILRHTTLTRLAEAGCDIKVLQYLFGQTDIRITMRVYNHIDSDRVKMEMNKLENLHRNLHRMKQYLCRLMKSYENVTVQR